MSDPDTKPPTEPATQAEDGGFLTRWSRRKRAAEAGQPLPEPAAPPAEAKAPTELADPTTLGFDDDFTAYLGAQVPAALKRAAMAKLFADPRFNEMDGLDVYIEDYNLVPNLSAEERELLAHAREVLSRVPTDDRQAPQPTEPVPESDLTAPVADLHGSLETTESPIESQSEPKT